MNTYQKQWKSSHTIACEEGRATETLSKEQLKRIEREENRKWDKAIEEWEHYGNDERSF